MCLGRIDASSFMRIVSYNILDGGLGRADPLAEIIEAQRADVVVLIEADNGDVVERIAKRLDMESIIGQGRQHTAAVLSRWAMVESINHGAVHDKPDCLLEATIRAPGGGEWIMGAVHLRARALEADEAERERELAVLLGIFESHRRAGRPHLLAGDFNSNSPIQRIDVEKVKRTTREAWQANGKQIPRRVVQKLLEAGYVDTLVAAHPEAAPVAASFTTQHPGQRVDYIFVHGIDTRRVQDAWIEQDRLAKYASDHFPIGVEIV